MGKVKAVKSLEAYRAWALAHPFCQLCGKAHKDAEFDGFCLTNHHLVKWGRSDEPCNLLRLCWTPCHMVCEGLSVVNPDGVHAGDRYPKLTLGAALTLKRLRDPGEVDMERLAELRGYALPVEEPVPQFWLDEYRRRRHVVSL